MGLQLFLSNVLTDRQVREKVLSGVLGLIEGERCVLAALL